MAVNDKQRRYLKGLAHPLKPVVMIGNAGLTENVLAEIENALAYHELIKVRVSGQEKLIASKCWMRSRKKPVQI